MDIRLAADETELRQALALLVAQEDGAPVDARPQVERIVRYVTRRRWSLQNCLVARERGALISACLCIDSPGRMSSVMIPPASGDGACRGATIRLLEEAARSAWGRDVRLLQAMVQPEAIDAASVYEQGGFAQIARLAYMATDLTQPLLSGDSPPPANWESYTSKTHALLARVVAGTYEDSLDCPALTRMRDLEDILESHRATGEFDPKLWLIALCGEEPIGVLLLAGVAEKAGHEVVYMGLMPRWRGRGYGQALLRRAVEAAREDGGLTLTLAVDTANTPALNLYRRFGFAEVCRRDAWVRLLSVRGSERDAALHLPS